MSTKIRLMSGGQHLLRVDDEISEEEITGTIFKDVEWKDKFLELLPTFDAIVISDYHKGAVSKSIAEMVVAYAKDEGIPVIVDAKKWFERFGGADIVKCNSSEWEQAKEHYQLNQYSDAVDFFGFHNMVVTGGSNGMTFCSKSGNFEIVLSYRGFSVQVADTCGAGDTVTAILAMCMAQPKTDANASKYTLANIAASEVCRHPGVYAITAADLIRRVREVGC
jgi:D-beta-D-heptose 7-phosphate kinase/D-beta-D-heptose 1-phosphate adenosyltransferase